MNKIDENDNDKFFYIGYNRPNWIQCYKSHKFVIAIHVIYTVKYFYLFIQKGLNQTKIM